MARPEHYSMHYSTGSEYSDNEYYYYYQYSAASSYSFDYGDKHGKKMGLSFCYDQHYNGEGQGVNHRSYSYTHSNQSLEYPNVENKIASSSSAPYRAGAVPLRLDNFQRVAFAVVAGILLAVMILYNWIRSKKLAAGNLLPGGTGIFVLSSDSSTEPAAAPLLGLSSRREYTTNDSTDNGDSADSIELREQGVDSLS